MPSKSIHVDKWQDFLLFYCWIIFHCIYTTFLYLFIHQWALWLLPCVGYCEKYCSDDGGADTFLSESVYDFLLFIYVFMKCYMLCPCIVQWS